jgi:hypothetical protein
VTARLLIAAGAALAVLQILELGAPGERIGVWLMPVGGLVALAGAVLALRQRSTRAS